MKRISLIYILLLGLFALPLFSQSPDSISWRKPLDLPINLSGNFGELRSNHFHGGVDFRTETVENKRVYAVQDGYVSRVSISPVGYGKALYVTHPGGYVTVSAHLNGFAPKIEEVVRRLQMEKESFELDVTFQPTVLSVKKGEWVALSGNTGSSGGPHLHFELRNDLEQQLDFLNYILRGYKDTMSPRIFGLSVYQFTDQGALFPPMYTHLYPIRTKNSTFSLDRTLHLWGKVAFGVRALDYINQSEFNFGVKKVELFVDSVCIFESTMNKVNYNETRMMNSFIDYDTWYNKRLFYQKSYLEPGNVFPKIKAIDNGVWDVNEIKAYSCLYRLTDDVGNVSELAFEVIGDPSERAIPSQETAPSQLLYNWKDNQILNKGIVVQIPRESLFTNIHFVYSVRSSNKYLTPIHSLHKPSTPLRSEINLSIKLPKPLVAQPHQYVLAYIDGRGRVRYSAASIQNDRMIAQVKQFGDYAVSVDTVAPTITPLGESDWGKQGVIRFTVSDTQTRIKTYKGYVDGKFVLFEYDGKSRTIFCILSKEQIARKTDHSLRMIIADECQNTIERDYSFYY